MARSVRTPLTAAAFAVLLWAAPLTRSHAQAANELYTATHEQLDVTKVLLAQQDAWDKGDLNAYLSHYKDAPDTEAVLATPVRGLANIRAAYQLNFPRPESMGTLEHGEIEVKPLGETYALASGKYHLDRPRKFGGPVDGTFIDVLEKTAHGWQIIYSQSG